MTDPKKNVEARSPSGAGTPATRTPSHDVLDQTNTLSRQVSWFEVYQYAERLATSHGVVLNHLPLPGTPQWCGMPDTDARKLMALVLGGVREALNHEVVQEHLADAGKKIAASADWSALAQRIQSGHGPYIPRKAS
ncbi:DUF2742 domain-containing protein [Mycolicibacterium wolinskyi]|uniref:DUF2742 domain-containing protein n=1 Tax=Mycolicibacterium wolinskyi TaxID=59750 RepID=A0A1X2EV02_9MYCO|nr:MULTISPECIES: DUF2742 domain-containing protein [Mycolicibacterium]MCV7287277.1 DUF2742 domain-containing protein [Mycolicibacterium wolinskyi]MCV7292770.1 DUF2742 domain-containing protein [Mycolicibacterium goodii]ORX09954.1 hypothetical protein AWC31_07085 [Mycolicibacterium wolinskyi]